MSTDADGRDQTIWKDLCLSKGWQCRLCGAIPEIGTEFEKGLCEDCQLSLRNYESTST